MKKIILAVLTAAALFSVAGCKKAEKPAAANNDNENVNVSEQDKGPEKFILGLDASFPPMGYTEAGGEIVGYDIDLAKEVCKRLGKEFVAKPIDWDSKEIELSTGSIDCIWNGFTITEERQEAMSFTPAYLNNDQVLVVRNDGSVKTLADAAKKVIGTQAGSSGEEAIADNKDFASSVKKVVKYDDYLTALTDLSVGGIDGIVMDSVVAEYQITIGKLNLTVLPESLAKEAYGVGFRKGEEGAALRDEVWAVLENMVEDGTVKTITEKWFGSDISVIGK